MAGNTDIGFAVSGISTVVCYGLAYFIFRKLIGDQYGKGRERQNGVYFWCGFIGVIAIGQGLGTVVNEVLFSMLTGVGIRREIVERGIFTLVGFPVISAFIAFLIVKIRGEKNQENRPRSIYLETNKSAAKLSVATGTIVVTAAALLIALVVVTTSIFKTDNSKTLLISACESCRNNECKAFQSGLKKIKIEDEKKIIFFVEKDGELSLQQRPSADETCTIVKSENYAFECIKSSKEFLVDGISFSQSFTASYNGKDKYSWTAKFHSVNGEKVFDKLTCIAK